MHTQLVHKNVKQEKICPKFLGSARARSLASPEIDEGEFGVCVCVCALSLLATSFFPIRLVGRWSFVGAVYKFDAPLLSPIALCLRIFSGQLRFLFFFYFNNTFPCFTPTVSSLHCATVLNRTVVPSSCRNSWLVYDHETRRPIRRESSSSSSRILYAARSLSGGCTTANAKIPDPRFHAAPRIGCVCVCVCCIENDANKFSSRA